MLARAAIVGVVALLVAGLFQLDDPHTAAPAPRSPVVGSSVREGDGATWYCAAGAEGTTQHQVVVSNPGGELTARIVGYRDAGGGTPAEVAAAAPTSTTVDIPAASLHAVSVGDIGTGIGGVTVELSGPDAGRASVAHRLLGESQSDESTCATEGAASWHFPSAATELGSTAKLWIVNPFPTDASVDVRVTTEAIVRRPGKLRGLIIPAGTSKLVDLSVGVSRRPQVAFTVEAIGGRVVAELVQTETGRGLRMQPGVPEAAPSWVIADSFPGAEVAQQLVVYNPTTSDVVVQVAAVPNTTPDALPEPFVLEIGPRRYEIVDVADQARIDPDLARWFRIDTIEGEGVVAELVVAITGAGGDGSAATRPSVGGGYASTTGSSAAATRWYATSLDPGPDSQSVVVVANPSPDAIALVTATRISGGSRKPVADKFEVPPLSSLVVDLTDAGEGQPLAVEISSETPVVASARTTSVARVELAMWPMVPDRAGATELPAPPGP